MCRQKIMDAYVPEGVRDWGVTRFSAEDDDLSAILGQAQTLPMLAPQQVIFVSDVEAWERLGEDSRDALVKQLSAYLENPAPFSILVFEADALDQRMRLAKTLAEKTVTVSVELSEDPVERARLAVPIVLEMARELGVEAGSRAAGELSEILNGELASIRTEIEKLAAYAGERRKITRADVDLLVVSAQKIYSVGTGGHARRSASRRARWNSWTACCGKGKPTPQLLGALAWTYRKLLEAQELPANTTGWQAASRLKMRRAGGGTGDAAIAKIPARAADQRTGGAVRSRQPVEIGRNKPARGNGISGGATGRAKVTQAEAFAQIACFWSSFQTE